MGKLRILLEMAVRNLFASRINLVIGAIVFFGTLLVVCGGAMVQSVEHAMSRSIRGSIGGDLQVFSSKSKEDLALFGGMGGADPDLSPVTDFSKVEKTLLSVPNVKAVVPMGIGSALVTGGNTIDLTLADLREAKKAHLANPSDKDALAKYESLKSHVQQIVTVLQTERGKLDVIRKKTAEDVEADNAIAKAATPAFWTDFDKDADAHLEFLENKIAPQDTDAQFLFLRYCGTDLDAFTNAFDRLRIVDGTAVPKGQRGMILAKRTYEEQLKLKTAHRLDQIHDALAEGTKIADDATLQRYVKENRHQPREILLQLDDIKNKKVVAVLQKTLDSKEGDLAKLLDAFFDTTDDNFAARYKTFYDDVAPQLQLYRPRIGDMLTIKAFSRSGYMQSVNVKIYGTFEFSGLEKSSLAGAMNLMDIVSFRKLYGFLSADKLEEISDLKKAAGATDVGRDKVEDALFGGGGNVVSSATPGLIEEAAHMSGKHHDAIAEAAMQRVYSKDEMDDGLVLNAAVLLKNPDALEMTEKDIVAAADRDHLELKALTWQQAAGLIGQFVLVAKLGLYFAVFIIFLVVLVIINNAVMMATMQRVREIGTLRAIGAKRFFVLTMVLVETVMIGVVFGGAGLVAGSSIMGVLHSVGIAAHSDQLYFFFSGPRLFPTLAVGNLIVAFVIVLFVSAVSTLYPAVLAAGVSPLRAMQSDD